MNRSWKTLAAAVVTGAALLAFAVSAAAQAGKKPNILVIFGDDVGVSNISL